MPSYETEDMDTIDVIVGKEFKIVGQRPVHTEEKLSFPLDAFDLINTEHKSTRKIGGSNPTVYTLKSLKPGTYEIEYQRIEPEFSEKPGQVANADLYHVIVSPKD